MTSICPFSSKLLHFLLLPIPIISFLLTPTTTKYHHHHHQLNHLHQKHIENNQHHHRSILSSSNDDFIDYILSPPSNDPSFRCTHMIGIPLEQNHDLLLELESIQRAILYHCPLLINACIAPVVTRMPLLMVDTKNDGMGQQSSSANGSGIDVNDLFNRNKNGLFDDFNDGNESSSPGENELLTSRDPITRTLHGIVNSVIDEMINVETIESSSLSNNDDNEEEEENENREGVNNSNIKPLLLKFEGLEIDGDKNEVLHAIGTEEEGTIKLRNVLNEITKRIEQKGWKVYIPEDNPQGKMGGLNEDGVTWRPRIPFMRLPTDFFDTLPDPQGYDGQWQNYTDEEKKNYMRVPEEGGNGISPLFWFKWWDDRLCNGKSIRIREFAVYGRTGPMGMTEQAFYIPHLRTRLPDGNSVLQEDERRDREYDNERRIEQEVMIDGSDVTDDSTVETKFEKEMATYKSNADRRILQTIFDSSPSDLGGAALDIDIDDYDEKSSEQNTKQSYDASSLEEAVIEVENNKNEIEENVDAIGSKEKEIIQSIAKPIATGDWTSLRTKKDKPKPEDNPVLRNWKQRVSESPKILQNDTGNIKTRSLPPFPSDEHFAGIWRLETGPRGSSVEEESLFGSTPNSSESIVLRIDGTTAGGPILDTENQHRAAGGVWKFFQAQWVGSPEDKDSEPIVKTRLRIRLLIPPLKQKVLVMEGEVRSGAIISPESISRQNMNELRKSSFESILGTNAKENQTDVYSSEEDSFLQCSGEMWCEDVGSRGKNRVKVGRFHLSKKNEEGTKYKYSIPSPQRYQD